MKRKVTMFKWLKRKKIQLTGMSWYDVTVDQFQRMKGLDMTDFDNQIEAASILLGINCDDMQWKDFCKELKKLEFLNEEMPKTIIRKSYTLNGRKYNCLPNLQELTVTRYMDFTTLAKEGDMVKILGVFLIPEGKEYGTYDLEEVYEDIRTMNIVEASGIYNFFLLEFRVCISTLQDYSVKVLKKNPELRNLVLEVMESCSISDL